MQRAAAIYNPASGARRERRMRDIEAVLRVLRAGGVEVEAIATTGPGSASEQARQAAAAGHDAVIACGGDGTVNEVLQGIAGSAAVLGIVPLGTGNVLARELGLGGDPAEAAKALLAAEVKTVGAGRITFHHKHQPGTRLFAAAAGIGADAQIMYDMTNRGKGRFGMAAYYAAATQVWLRHELVPFAIEYLCDGQRRKETVYQALAVRCGDFGGLLGRVVPEASLERDDFALVLLRRKSRARITQFLLGRLLRRRWSVPGVEIVFASEAECTLLPGPEPEKGAHHHPHSGPKLYAEADGEVVGSPPARLDVVPAAMRLLVPRKSAS